MANTSIGDIHVLCVDDEVQVLSLLSDTLRAEGYEVQTAVDGTEARAGRPALRSDFADARMPNLDGWRLIMEARAGGFVGKVIVFSALMDDHERQRYRYLEIDRFLEKPRNQASSCGL